MKERNGRKVSADLVEREIVVETVGTPEEVEAARRRALRIFADWIRGRLQENGREEDVAKLWA